MAESLHIVQNQIPTFNYSVIALQVVQVSRICFGKERKSYVHFRFSPISYY